MDNAAIKFLHMLYGIQMHSFLFGVYLEVGLLDFGLSVCLVLVFSAKKFYRVIVPI